MYVNGLPMAVVGLFARAVTLAGPSSPLPPAPHAPILTDAFVGAHCSKNPAAPECNFSIDGRSSTKPASVSKAGPANASDVRVCQEVPVFIPLVQHVVTVGDPSVAGRMTQQECTVNGRMVDSSLVFTPTDPAAPAVSAQQLAQHAYQALVMPKPDVGMSPRADVPQLAGLPAWLWLKPGSWSSKSVTLAAGGVTVTATATPRQVVWSMGDGTTETCAGPGTPFPEHPTGDGTAPSPTCGHTYRRSSATEPSGAFHITATVAWRVDWTGFGPGGTFPDVESSTGFPVRVIEAAALVTNSH
ncbi:hypothetical protein [Catenulispora sp. EB89]|uniref:hypothetical protein n=1 Tax=Catenulispora sp. EB89 TaxID=3156257 RepID=UPI00351955CB